MIKLLPLIFVFITFIISAQSANRTYVPDDAFEQALIDLGYDDVLDDYVLTANINTITELDISQIERGGLNLTGIEDFIALEVLNCRSNSSVTNMNLNPLVHLEELNVLACWVAIDTSNNPELRILITGNPSFIGGPSLDLSNNPKLEVLLAGTEVDLSNNPLLKRLSFTEFAISQLDVSNNPELEYLNLGLDNFYLETIDLSNNPNLIELNLGETSIKSLDLSNNPRLERVYGSVKTNLEYLNLKSGSNQVLVEVTVNVSDCVQVDDVAYAEAQENWNVGVDRFSEDCSAPSPLTYVPDDNFEQALIDLGRDDVLDDYVATFSILAIDDLYLNDTTISDLTGIEDFVNLKELFLIDTPISQLDIRNLSDLEHLEIENTELTNVSTNENTSLNWVRLDGDIEFNLSNNRGLLYLTLENIAVRDLDFTLYPDLRYLNINSNETITRLNLSQNTLIRHLELRGNPSLQYLNLKNGNNTSLDYFQMHFNESVTCIEVDDVNYANNNGRFIIDSQAVFSEDCNDNGGATYVPDDNFEQALIDLGYDNELDDYVLTSNINTITELNIDEISRGSLDLTGIQDFVALRVLNCSSNAPIYGGSTTPFTLNTSQMLQLEELYVYDSYLTIDTSNNPELRVLITGSSTLGAGSPILDVTQNPKLEELRAGKPVDLTNNPLLRWLHFGPFTLSSLDLSNNTELEVLNLGIENLGLEELDLSNNPKLIELVLGETGIRSLDLSNNTLLEKVHRGSFYSNLEYLNLKNGNNQILTDVDARVSGCVQVDDVAYAEAQTNWFIGSGRYSENCFEDLTYVPDDAFEQALIDRGYDDVLDDYVLTANIDTITELNINAIAGRDEFNLTGIEDFISLKILECGDNNSEFFSLDTSQMSQLEELYVFNSFASLDTSNNPELRILITGNTSDRIGPLLDLSNNPKLEELSAGAAVDVSNNPLLKRLVFSEFSVFTDSTPIDLSNNPELTYLDLGDNAGIKELDVSNNTKLVELRFYQTEIESLDLSNNPMLETVTGERTLLQFLDLKNGNNIVLSQLNVPVECAQVDDVAYAEAQTNWNIYSGSYSENCFGNLTYVPDNAFEQALIDQGYDSVLDDYVLTENLESISELLLFSEYNVADFTGLEGMINLEGLNYFLEEGSNGYVPSLDASKNTKLESLIIRNVKLGSLDLSNNLLLKRLSLSNSDLGALDVSKNLDLEFLTISGSQIETFDVSQNTELTYLIVSGNDNLVSLNIKNGANENLINESVLLTDNSRLFCIQVDNYVLSSSNLRWKKDDHASFSTDCSAATGDGDSDGVPDAVDSCPNTAPNDPVSPQGCSLAQYTDLVVQNISIGVGSDPCSQSASGYIEIGVLQEVFDLNVAIYQYENKVFEATINANTPLFLDGLSGAYRICVSSALAPNGTEFGSYCYEAACGPADNTLRTTVRIQNPDQVYSISVSGSKSYEVAVNGNSYTYDFDTIEKQQIDIPLEVGMNAITVTGKIDCNDLDSDGVVDNQEPIDELILFPTLTDGKFTIVNNKRHEISTIAVASLEGKRVELLPIHDNPETINMNLSGNTKGMYIVRIEHKSGKVNTVKVIIK